MSAFTLSTAPTCQHTYLLAKGRYSFVGAHSRHCCRARCAGFALEGPSRLRGPQRRNLRTHCGCHGVSLDNTPGLLSCPQLLSPRGGVSTLRVVYSATHHYWRCTHYRWQGTSGQQRTVGETRRSRQPPQQTRWETQRTNMQNERRQPRHDGHGHDLASGLALTPAPISRTP